VRLTPFVTKALAFLARHEHAPASWVAGELWDDGEHHDPRRWLRCAQGLLGKMRKRGLVERNSTTRTTLWRITAVGREALKECP
jgi:hypothetical protein